MFDRNMLSNQGKQTSVKRISYNLLLFVGNYNIITLCYVEERNAD